MKGTDSVTGINTSTLVLNIRIHFILNTPNTPHWYSSLNNPKTAKIVTKTANNKAFDKVLAVADSDQISCFILETKEHREII